MHSFVHRIGYFWGLYFPINKALWTSSFVIFTAGWALLVLSVLYFLLEDLKMEVAFTDYIEIFGQNAILVFYGSGVIPRLLNTIKINNRGLKDILYQDYIVPYFSEPINASLAGALIFLVIWWVVLILLKSRKIKISV